MDTWSGSKRREICLIQNNGSGRNCKRKKCDCRPNNNHDIMIVKNSLLEVEITSKNCKNIQLHYEIHYGGNKVSASCEEISPCRCRKNNCIFFVNCSNFLRRLSLLHYWNESYSPDSMSVVVNSKVKRLARATYYQSHMDCKKIRKKCNILTLDDPYFECDLETSSVDVLACNCVAKQQKRSYTLEVENPLIDLPRLWYETRQGFMDTILVNLASSDLSKFESVIPHPYMDLERSKDKTPIFSSEEDHIDFRDILLLYMELNMTCTDKMCNDRKSQQSNRKRGNKHRDDKKIKNKRRQ